MYRAKLSVLAFAFYEQDFDGDGNRLRLADELRAGDRITSSWCCTTSPSSTCEPARSTTLEALVRWRHPRARADPTADVPAAGRGVGPDGRADRWVLDEALAQCAAWRPPDAACACRSTSPAGDLLEPGFADLVVGAARPARACPPTRWCWRSPRPASSTSSSAPARPCAAARARRPGVDRRLRRRVHVAGLPQRPRGRRAEARPRFITPLAGGAARAVTRARPCHDRAGARAPPPGGRRGSRGRRRARPAAPTGL